MTEATDEVIDDVTDVTEYNDTTDEGIEVSNDNAKLLAKYKIDPTTFTEDDLIATLKRIDKAESRIVAEKKNPKSEPTTKYLTEADLERRDFLKANPELYEYTKDWEQKVKSGYTFEDAKDSVLKSDKARVNREKVNSLGLSD
jgi:HD superfamily phosphodiesterase